MSITSARNFMEKSGCGLVVSVGLAVVIVFGLIIVSLQSQQDARQDIPPELLKPIATVGTQPITAHAVDRHFKAQAAQQLNDPDGVAVELEALVYAQQLEALLYQAAGLELAGRRGIKVSDQEVVDFIAKSFDSRVSQMREQLKQFGLIKPDATEAEVQEVLNRSFGGDVAEFRKRSLDQAREALKDPSIRPELVFAATGQKLQDAYSSQVQISDEDLVKAQHKTIFKRISFRVSEQFEQTSEIELMEREERKLALAQKVLAEIKSGLSFEAAMDKYSEDTAPAGKKKSETTVDLQQSVLSFDPDYAPLVNLKPGEVSPVVFHTAERQFLIFKAIRSDTTPPADFESNKEEYRKNRMALLANAKIREETEKLTDHDAVKWASPGFKALHKWYTVLTDKKLLENKEKRLAELESVAKEAKAVSADADSVGSRAAALAYFVSLDRVYRAASAQKRKDLAEDWTEAASLVLENVENANLRVDLARTYLEMGRAADAHISLAAASQANAGVSDEAIRRYTEIQALRAKLVAAGVGAEDLKELDGSQEFWATDAVDTVKNEAEGNIDYTEGGRTKLAEINRQVAKLQSLELIKPEDVKAIEAFNQTWKVEKAKYDEELAEERRKADEEAKKAAIEAQKKAEEEKKNPKPPSSSGTAGAAPGNPLTGTTSGKAGG